MFKNKNNVSFLLIFILFCYSLASCNKTENSNQKSKESIVARVDKTCTWLENQDHFYLKEYMPTFYTYYNQKIKTRKYKDATIALETVCIRKAYNSIYDKRFMRTIKTYCSKYRSRLPELETTFIDAFYSNFYLDQGKLKQANYHSERIIAIEPIDQLSYLNTAYAYYDLSFSNNQLGNQKLAIQNCFKALHYFKKGNLPAGTGDVYLQLSSIFLSTKNYQKSLYYSDLAIADDLKTNNKSEIFMDLFNRIPIYEEMKSPKLYLHIDSTYHFFKNSKIKDDVMNVTVSTIYVQKLLHEKKFSEAKQILDNLKPMVVELNSPTSWNEFYVASADYEIKCHPNGIVDNSALEETAKTLRLEENFKELIIFLSIMKDDCIRKKQYERALEYEEEINDASNKFANQQSSNKVIELETKFRTNQKTQQIKLNRTTIENKNKTIAILISSLIGFFFFIVYIIAQQKQKKLVLVKESTQKYTKQLLEKTEEERKRIASDLHDSVSHELLSLKNSIEEKSAQTDSKIDLIINDIRNISRNLHPIMFDKVGLTASIEQLVERTQTLNNFMITAEIDYNNTLTNAAELQVYRILQEALSNCIKYAKAVAAKITIEENNQSLMIQFKDNGIGFDVNETLKSKNSFGLHNIIERGRAIGGEATIVSNKKGTHITIEILKNHENLNC